MVFWDFSGVLPLVYVGIWVKLRVRRLMLPQWTLKELRAVCSTLGRLQISMHFALLKDTDLE